MIVVVAGGVGGARMASGLAGALPPEDVVVIVNTADDFEHLGLSISPDLDTVMYTLAGLEHPSQGWGLAEETWSFMAALERIGGETWFRLGDRDLATHIERSRRLAAGESLSVVTRALCGALGVRARVLPMSDDPVRTFVDTEKGEIAFQHYFVQQQCGPHLRAVRFAGIETARPAEACLAALTDPRLEAVIIAPSNPYVSVAPVLALRGLRERIGECGVPVVAVSPIVGARAIKGPAAKMMRELGVEPSALGIAAHYSGVIDGIVIDDTDVEHAGAIRSLGIVPLVCDTIMRDCAGRERLARATIDFARQLSRQRHSGGTSR